MNLKYFVLLITLKNISCYNPKRHTQISSNNLNNSKSKTSNHVVPARYKITNKANYEDPTAESFPSEFFPEVEYPESIVDSSKPFYLSASPFPKEVKSTFNALAAQRNKAKSTTDYSWIHNDKSKEKISPPELKVGVNEVTDTKGNEINSNDKSTNETLAEDIAILVIEDDIANYRTPYSDNDMDRLFINWTSNQSSECPELDYVVGFIDDLDKFMRNLTALETAEPDESKNSTLHAVESERTDEIQSVKFSATTNYNESGTELNGHSFLTGEQPERIRDSLFKSANDPLTNYTPLLNENIRNTSSVEDMQNDFCSVGTTANETFTSCAKS
ncbi:hypothetical protein B5X24_HaOG201477 [Helicoverpa armigera]|nr:hypothetical protein B5X24_HaOG201477 [Helicoverpa armigera]